MAREGVPRLELVEPRGEPHLGPALLIAGPALAVLGSDQLCLGPLSTSLPRTRT